MSNVYDTINNIENTPNSPEISSGNQDKEESRLNISQKRWQTVQSDLLSAISSWNDLEKTEGQLSPEEAQLNEIKDVIKEIKSKLNQFDCT